MPPFRSRVEMSLHLLGIAGVSRFWTWFLIIIPNRPKHVGKRFTIVLTFLVSTRDSLFCVTQVTVSACGSRFWKFEFVIPEWQPAFPE